jgi:DNA-binding CsgD family transcriptional regulator
MKNFVTSVKKAHAAISEGFAQISHPESAMHVMKELGSAVGSGNAYLLQPGAYGRPNAESVRADRRVFELQSGLPLGFYEDYASWVWQLDPWFEVLKDKMPRIEQIGGFIGSDHISHARMRSLPIYAHYLQPMGMQSHMCATLRGGTLLGFLNDSKSSDFSTEHLSLTQTFSARFSDFIFSWRELQVGLVEVNESLVILRLNHVAKQMMLSEQSVSHVQAVGLFSLSPSLTSSLQKIASDALHHGQSQAQIQISQIQGNTSIQVIAKRVDHFIPTLQTKVLLQLLPAKGLERQEKISLLSKKYDLTASQVQVLLSLQHNSPKNAAASLNLQVATVRAHLSAIFRKTSTKNQVELQRLIDEF